jgi:hypothetical protein
MTRPDGTSAADYRTPANKARTMRIEPRCLSAPNESLDPGEIERIALAEALFLDRYAMAGA